MKSYYYYLKWHVRHKSMNTYTYIKRNLSIRANKTPTKIHIGFNKNYKIRHKEPSFDLLVWVVVFPTSQTSVCPSVVECKSQLLGSPHISDARPRDSWTGTALKVSTLWTNFYATKRGIQASTTWKHLPVLTQL